MKQKSPQKLWFKAKRYGWGWYPATWQGWLILAAYLVLIGLDYWWRNAGSDSDSQTLLRFIPETLLLTVILIGICWKTGEKPRWRWG